MKQTIGLVLVLALGAGCDLKPAPAGSEVAPTAPSAPAPAAPGLTGEPPAPPPGAPAPAPPATPPDAAPIPPPQVAVSDDCVALGDRIAGIIIESTTDAPTKAAIEQDRTKFVRRLAEACTTQPWPAEAKACFEGAKSADDVQACGEKLTGQPAQ